MELVYKENRPVSARQIARLRHRIGWNGMERCYADPRMAAFDHIACYDGDQLIGYVDTVSNGVTDAYIQDLMVDPAYQGQGIGTELMNRIIARLKENNIYMISVVYDAELLNFYQRFGFKQMLCGQLQTREIE